MDLYTVCINQVPTLVISANTEVPFPDSCATDLEAIKALRLQHDIERLMSPDFRNSRGLREVAKALDTWLGIDLLAMTQHGIPLWSGNPEHLHVRKALFDEKKAWQASHQRAIAIGALDAGKEDWVTNLVPLDAETIWD